MVKYTILLVVVASVLTAQGFPYPQLPHDLASQAALGNWDAVHNLLTQWHQQINHRVPISQKSVAHLAPQNPGDKVFGEAHTSIISSSTNNGHTAVSGKEHTLINENGKIYEYERPIGFSN